MEGDTFLYESIQEEFRRFVEIRIHTDHGDPELANRGKQLQRSRFKTIALPFYAVLDPSGETVYWKGAGVLSEARFLAGLRKAPDQRP